MYIYIYMEFGGLALGALLIRAKWGSQRRKVLGIPRNFRPSGLRGGTKHHY